MYSGHWWHFVKQYMKRSRGWWVPGFSSTPESEWFHLLYYLLPKRSGLKWICFYLLEKEFPSIRLMIWSVSYSSFACPCWFCLFQCCFIACSSAAKPRERKSHFPTRGWCWLLGHCTSSAAGTEPPSHAAWLLFGGVRGWEGLFGQPPKRRSADLCLPNGIAVLVGTSPELSPTSERAVPAAGGEGGDRKVPDNGFPTWRLCQRMRNRLPDPGLELTAALHHRFPVPRHPWSCALWSGSPSL